MSGPTPSQPGWYADGDGGERWYDGNAWTDHRRGAAADESTVVVPTPATGELPIPPTPGPPVPGPLPPGQLQVGRGLRIALAVGGVLVLIAIAVVGGIVLMGEDKDKDSAGDDASSTTSDVGTPADESSLDLPTIDSSDFPTDMPTPPSSSSTDQPDQPDQPDLPGLPSGFPSDFPTEFPTDPSALESWFSDYLEQVQP
ncbi:MAG: DUF2510 domain-containing protein [Propionibacteriales bacterium]|nr:DUF2510 domain-containing protein [Propionibacteriales bacterium]